MIASCNRGDTVDETSQGEERDMQVLIECMEHVASESTISATALWRVCVHVRVGTTYSPLPSPSPFFFFRCSGLVLLDLNGKKGLRRRW